MQREELRLESDPPADREADDEGPGPEPTTPAIDEDVAGSVNAAVPDDE